MAEIKASTPEDVTGTSTSPKTGSDMKIRVLVFYSWESMVNEWPPFVDYTMDHDDPSQRRVLGEQCRNALEGGQCVITYPVVS